MVLARPFIVFANTSTKQFFEEVYHMPILTFESRNGHATSEIFLKSSTETLLKSQAFVTSIGAD
jgi:hypothetical protein